MECNRQNFFVILVCLLPFCNPKNQNFEKNDKIPGDIIILHSCTINHNHMMHGSRDSKHNGQNLLSFWTIFCPNNPKNQNFEKMKKIPGDVTILDMRTINDNHMMYDS